AYGGCYDDGTLCPTAFPLVCHAVIAASPEYGHASLIYFSRGPRATRFVRLPTLSATWMSRDGTLGVTRGYLNPYNRHVPHSATACRSKTNVCRDWRLMLLILIRSKP